MARTYAGVLGSLAFCTVVARGLICGGDSDSIFKLAAMSLFGFAAIGYVAGRIAATTITQSVQARMNAELQALETRDESNAATM